MRAAGPGPDTRIPLCKGINIEDASISQLQQWLRDDKFTARDLTKCYLERIRRLDGVLKFACPLSYISYS
jgi:amidase